VSRTASYRQQPDKESPLWNIYSKVIYWWTASEVSDKQAYIVVYNGGVWARTKTMRPGYLTFRAVRAVSK
jgi:2',3'-cyclic-nucleotide 2'-phosphodiesterase (5'-nucleotidase family)